MATATYLTAGSTSMGSSAYTTIIAVTTPGLYSVAWCLIGNAGSTHMGIARVIYNGLLLAIAESTVGAATACQVSGTDFQIRQSSGSTQTMNWSYTFAPL